MDLPLPQRVAAVISREVSFYQFVPCSQSSLECKAAESSSFLQAKGLEGESKASVYLPSLSSAGATIGDHALAALRCASCCAIMPQTTAHATFAMNDWHCMDTLYECLPHARHAHFPCGHLGSTAKDFVQEWYHAKRLLLFLFGSGAG